jgi:hypothetical protein
MTVLAWTMGRYGDNNYTITMLKLRCEIKTFSTYTDNDNNTMKKQGCVNTTYTDNDGTNAR